MFQECHQQQGHCQALESRRDIVGASMDFAGPMLPSATGLFDCLEATAPEVKCGFAHPQQAAHALSRLIGHGRPAGSDSLESRLQRERDPRVGKCASRIDPGSQREMPNATAPVFQRGLDRFLPILVARHSPVFGPLRQRVRFRSTRVSECRLGAPPDLGGRRQVLRSAAGLNSERKSSEQMPMKVLRPDAAVAYVH